MLAPPGPLPPDVAPRSYGVAPTAVSPTGPVVAAVGAGEAVWHTDMSYLDMPPDASMLYALEIPGSGGNTWFCGMQAACAALHTVIALAHDIEDDAQLALRIRMEASRAIGLYDESETRSREAGLEG